ncbi:hypothetical protein IQ266_04805 [filamentous cyanobacterium LEGE 11480]|uniref:Uncharacterized protein n=1 Tax=Romeriopsis navalis LEGE 11480 TaxID=2777977 RepID=A0A928VM75_9CYAN|nr:hypothetical protein [Romeriopsis navalis]MBE9029080.1 hypothetical protein [Romeriopsis navalis LEGE 11480]
MLEYMIIETLTPQQQAQARIYQQKWQMMAYETTSITATTAQQTLIDLAQILKIPTPQQTCVLDSPFALFRQTPADLAQHQQIMTAIGSLVDRLSSQVKRQMAVGPWVQLWQSLAIQTLDPIEDALWLQIQDDAEKQEQLIASVKLEGKRHFIARLDFCINELGCACDRATWSAVECWAKDCGFLRWVGDRYEVSDRPQILVFGDHGQLHGIEEPAIVYRDGSKVYSNGQWS